MDKVIDLSKRIINTSPPTKTMTKTKTLRDSCSQELFLQDGSGDVQGINLLQQIMLSENDAKSCGSESSEAMILDECDDLNEDEKSVSTLQKPYCVTSPKNGGTIGGSQGGFGDFYSLSFNNS